MYKIETEENNSKVFYFSSRHHRHDVHSTRKFKINIDILVVSLHCDGENVLLIEFVVLCLKFQTISSVKNSTLWFYITNFLHEKILFCNKIWIELLERGLFLNPSYFPFLSSSATLYVISSF